MAKVTLVFEDTPEGTVNVKMDFDPVLNNKPGVMLTDAQSMAFTAMDALSAKHDAVSDQFYDDDEDVYDEEEE